MIRSPHRLHIRVVEWYLTLIGSPTYQVGLLGLGSPIRLRGGNGTGVFGSPPRP